MACDLSILDRLPWSGVTLLTCFSPLLFSAQCCLNRFSTKSWFFFIEFPFSTLSLCHTCYMHWLLTYLLLFPHNSHMASEQPWKFIIISPVFSSQYFGCVELGFRLVITSIPFSVFSWLGASLVPSTPFTLPATYLSQSSLFIFLSLFKGVNQTHSSKGK